MTWVFAAFTTVWIALFIYLFGIDRKQRALQQDVSDLRNRIG